ncbi:hypothetical protein V499_09693 [Pseudogymnoascus sp. VKM F-103]|nr:hypothetical protein V499_09693 [Pseudogymnoascus sp. VKM F-103]
MLTLIKVPGKRKRKQHTDNADGENKLSRPKGRPRKETIKKIKTSASALDSGTASRQSPQDNFTTNRSMTSLERLPTELLEKIFLVSLNFNLPRSSPIIGIKLSNQYIYTTTTVAIFEPTWRYNYGLLYEGGGTASDSVDGGDIPGDPELQSSLLRCQWATVFMIQQAEKAWLLTVPPKQVKQEVEGVAQARSHSPAFDSEQLVHTETRTPAERLSGDSEPHNFDEQYAEFLRLTHPEAAREEGMTTRPTFRWKTPHKIHPQTEIPESLLRGPWSPDMVMYLFWLTRAGATIDYSASTNGEVARQGLDQAILDGNLQILYLLHCLGIETTVHEDILESAVRTCSGNNAVMYRVFHILASKYPGESSSWDKWLDDILDFAEKLGQNREEKRQQRICLPVPVPSSSLLRFLQFQSEGRCFFSANSQGFNFDHGSPPGPQQHTAKRLGAPKPSSSHLWAPIPTPATCEASLLNLDFLIPRVTLPPAIRPSINSPRPLAKVIRRSAKHSIGGYRCASESHSADWLRRAFGRKVNRRRPLKGVEGPYGDEGAEATAYALGRTMSAKAANEQKLRCTEFDENGNVVLVNGEFKKSELIAKYGLLPRDLRKIDSSLLPHILVRPSAILINLLHLRCLIKANRVLVFDTYGSTDSYTQSVFMYDLEGKLRQKQNSPSAGGLPYEFRALEAVLISVTSGLEGEFETVRGPVVRVLRELEEDIDRDKLRHLLIYSKKLGTFEQKAKLVRDAIDELLEADDDLASMYLTEKTHDLLRGEDDHTEVEMLLESYHKVCDEIVQASGNLVSNIRNTEEIVKAILDANRNALMLLDLKFSIGTLGIGSGAFIAALYGMNLKNFIEESNFGFLGISGFSAVFAAIVCGYGLTKLRKVQRVSMWGEAGKRGARGSWRAIDEETGAGLLERSRRARLLKEDKGGSLREVVGNVKPLPPTVILKTT